MSKNRITYANHTKTEFIDELREKVNSYFRENRKSKFGNSGIKVKSALMLILYFFPFILMLTGTISSLPLVLISWALMGIGMAGLGMVLMHDANHSTYSKNRKVNSFLGKSIYLLGGFPPTWKFQHNTLHHGFTNIDGHDEDIRSIGFLRFSPHQPHKRIHTFQHWYAWLFYTLMTISWITAKDFRQLKNWKENELFVKNNKSYNKLYRDLIISKVGYYALFLILPLILMPIAWYWVLLGFLMMQLIAGFSLTVIFQTAHVMPSSSFPIPDEKGNIENSWAIHQLMTTTDYAPNSRIFSWLIGGLNYQVVHHLFPTISHVHYKDLSKIVKETTEKYKLPYHVQPSFIKALKSHYLMLKNLGKNRAMA